MRKEFHVRSTVATVEWHVKQVLVRAADLGVHVHIVMYTPATYNRLPVSRGRICIPVLYIIIYTYANIHVCNYVTIHTYIHTYIHTCTIHTHTPTHTHRRCEGAAEYHPV